MNKMNKKSCGPYSPESTHGISVLRSTQTQDHCGCGQVRVGGSLVCVHQAAGFPCPCKIPHCLPSLHCLHSWETCTQLGWRVGTGSCGTPRWLHPAANQPQSWVFTTWPKSRKRQMWPGLTVGSLLQIKIWNQLLHLSPKLTKDKFWARKASDSGSATDLLPGDSVREVSDRFGRAYSHVHEHMDDLTFCDHPLPSPFIDMCPGIWRAWPWPAPPALSKRLSVRILRLECSVASPQSPISFWQGRSRGSRSQLIRLWRHSLSVFNHFMRVLFKM